MRRFTSSGCACTSKFATRAMPEVGFIRPVRILIVVVLPAAFGPSTTKNSPRLTVRLRSFTASTSPKRFTRWMSSIIAIGLAEPSEGVIHHHDVAWQLSAQDFAHGADVNRNLVAIDQFGL